MADEIIKELWEVKDELSDKCGRDVKSLAALLAQKGRARDTRLIDVRFLKPKADQEVSVDPNHAGTSGCGSPPHEQ